MIENDHLAALVSIIIPTYERPEYLEGAIRTALGQSYENIEVVIVDDGSSEPYANEIVSKFPDFVTCIRHKKNKGLSAARNTGIQTSNGAYVAFLDDDDRWDRIKIARQILALKRNNGAGLATCLVAAITPENKLVHCETDAPSGDCSKEILVSNKIGTPSRVLVRRECFKDVGTFDESLPTKQDWDFYLRLCQKWNVAAVEDYLCFRTVHDSMSSSPNSLERDKNTILQKHEDLIRSHGLWNQAQAAIAEEVGRSYLGQGKLKMAREHIHQSMTQMNGRRLSLFLLSYTHPTVIDSVISFKRAISTRLSDCDQLIISSSDIPGLSH
jgi:hypothetical protein